MAFPPFRGQSAIPAGQKILQAEAMESFDFFLSHTWQLGADNLSWESMGTPPYATFTPKK